MKTYSYVCMALPVWQLKLQLQVLQQQKEIEQMKQAAVAAK